ncbi:hypothetical protein N2152v2_007500 [Parachlorella kessleri]
MAFSFGASTPASTPAFSFGPAPTPAFGAAATPAPSSTPSFGFGSAAATPGFGAVSTPAFSAPSLFGAQPAASAPSLFGAAPAPAAGAASTPSLFGAASTPSLFGASSTPSFFGAQPASAAAASAPSFGFGTGALVLASSTPSLFGGSQQQQAAQQQQQQLAALVTKDSRPLTHTTKWDDLSPQEQQYLLELERKVVEFRDQCRQLDGEERLTKGKDGKDLVEKDARMLSQRITSLGTALRADVETCEAILELVRSLLRNTEAALYTFKRSYQWREGLKSAQGQALPSHLMDQLAGPVVLPSPFLRDAVAGFQHNLEQFKACAAELEQVLVQQQHDTGRVLGSSSNPVDMLQSLHTSLSNLHDLLLHTAAKLQAFDDRVGLAKEAHLATRRQVGDYSDPFSEAERQQQQAHGKHNGVHRGGQQAPPAAGAGQQAQQLQQPTGLGAGTSGFGGAASPFGAAMSSVAPAPGGLFGTLTPSPLAGASGFGTPSLFGAPAAGGSARKSKSKK